VPIDVERARMHRYRLNLTTGKVTEGRVSDIPLEFARVNETLVGTKTRYGYAQTPRTSRISRSPGVSLQSL
jgi:carotenoid cleavage dioxygenase